ncbi:MULTISPECIES: serine/threonine-protein kinase [unclassified Bradyrhizobium]|uniref:protein kinase domain-containing protein n=1 Tax=unclassified Bradyrhizobium TaxID=2631580 RepID=UPI00138F3479|nr:MULTISPECIES: serine/threonine-protein kinase [unclassified Bradyrhizobium]
MNNDQIKPGLSIDGRYSLVRQLGLGLSGATWLARDTLASSDVVVKFFPKRTSAQGDYQRHLIALHSLLSGIPLARWAAPIAVGELDQFDYQILPFFNDYNSLADIIRNGTEGLRTNFHFIAEVAEALAELHAAQVVHADLKPSNILVRSDHEEVRLIDFGMIRRLDNAVELVSTWRYLHPVFREGASAHSERVHTDRITVSRGMLAGTPVDTYVDVYALGIISLELLTSQTSYDRPLTDRSVSDLIAKHNEAFTRLPGGLKARIANFVAQLLSVSPDREVIEARTAASIARSILSDIPSDVSFTTIEQRQLRAKHDQDAGTATAVVALRDIRANLEQETLVLFAEGNRQVSISAAEPEAAILDQVSEVFTSARERVKSAWRIGMAMTVICFSLIILMIVIAVVMSITTGSFAWGGIFGSLGVSSVIGTLIWRPYDRLFRATIFAQQIEVIHIRVIAGLRSIDRGEQLRVCEEAIASLSDVFKEHTVGDKSLATARRKPGRKKLT